MAVKATGARASVAMQRSGEGARRLALWVMIVGLPLAYEWSGHLTGPRAYYGGNPAYWFAGLQVKLVLMGVGAAAVALGMGRGRGGLAALGWPARLRGWEVAVMAATLLLALAIALFYHPAVVSAQVYGVTASTPLNLLERVSLVGVALADALVQETVWRGAVVAWLRPHFGGFLAIGLSVASFVFFHPAPGWRWGQALVLLALALLYTGLVAWRRSLLPSIYLHFVLAAGQLLVPVAH